MAEIPALFAQRPIVLRHQKGAMYHPFIEAVALTLVDILIVFSAVLYEAVKLQQTASQFLCVSLSHDSDRVLMDQFYQHLLFDSVYSDVDNESILPWSCRCVQIAGYCSGCRRC